MAAIYYLTNKGRSSGPLKSEDTNAVLQWMQQGKGMTTAAELREDQGIPNAAELLQRLEQAKYVYKVDDEEGDYGIASMEPMF